LKLRINRQSQLMVNLKEVEIIKQALFIAGQPEVEGHWQGLEVSDVAQLGIQKDDVDALKKDIEGVAKRLWAERSHARLNP
jgi:hypothetical protein